MRLKTPLLAALFAVVSLFALADDASAQAISGRPRIVRGPSESTNLAIPKFSGTTGQALLSTGITIDSSNNIVMPASATVDGKDISTLGTGDVGGAASSTDNAICRMNGTGGKTIQNSLVTISDADLIEIPSTAGAGLRAYGVTGANAEYTALVNASSATSIRSSATSGGTPRTLTIQTDTAADASTGGGTLALTTTAATLSGRSATGAGPQVTLTTGASALTSTSAVQTVVRSAATCNQASGSGSCVIHRFSTTQTACGSGGCFNIVADKSGVDTFSVNTDGKILIDGTTTAGGVTGAQTINQPMGSVNFAAAASSLVVTNSLVSTSDYVFCTVQTNDGTAKSCAAVPGSGSFTLYLDAAATGETKVAFWVVRPQ